MSIEIALICETRTIKCADKEGLKYHNHTGQWCMVLELATLDQFYIIFCVLGTSKCPYDICDIHVSAR